MKRMSSEKSQSDWHWLQFSGREVGLVGVALVLLGGLFYYNITIAQGKARDWERKEQAKRVFNTLDAGYRKSMAGFPPNSDKYEIKGCGDQVCPLLPGQGTACSWGSDKPAMHLACGENDFMWLSPLPDNPLTPGPDALRYKNLGLDAVVEVCLERKDDAEGTGLDKSKIGWTSEDCPSGVLLIWPERQRQ